MGDMGAKHPTSVAAMARHHAFAETRAVEWAGAQPSFDPGAVYFRMLRQYLDFPVSAEFVAKDGDRPGIARRGSSEANRQKGTANTA
jgi:hypothetical protein